jgi:hypothetical protein
MDPPRGRRYGFPREVDQRLTLEEQLRKYGYPEHLMADAKKFTRYWYEEYSSERTEED